MPVNGFLVDNTVQKYNYESLENYNTPDFSTSSTYQVGDYVMYQGKLYRCTTEISTSGGWDSSKWSLAILSDDVANLRSAVESGEYGLSESAKQAILQIARKVVYVDDQGQTYYDDLYDAFYPFHIVFITAVYTQSGTVYDTDSLNSLKANLVVTATYSDSSTSTVAAADYTLSGTLTAGTSTITAAYSGKTDTFTVAVTRTPILPAAYQEVEYIAGDGNAYFSVLLNEPYPLGYKYKAKAYQSALDSSKARVAFGATTSGAYISFLRYGTTSGQVGASYGTANVYVDMTNLYDGPVESETVLTASEIQFSATNSSGTASDTVARTCNSPTYLRVFHNYYSGVEFIGRVYYAQVYDTSDNLVNNFVPCYRIADNVVGMYDTITDTFYSSDTATPFTKGGNV